MIPKQILPLLRPMLKPAIEQGQIELKKYLDSVPLNEGETDCRIISEYDKNGNLHLIVTVFSDKEISRAIGAYSATDLINLINKVK